MSADSQGILGLNEMDSAIRQMNQQLASRLPEIVMEGAQIVEQEIRQRAPVKTGKLVASIDAASSRRSTSASATVQVERSGKSGVEHYAIFQEYGTSKMPAHPFFRPGVAAAEQTVSALLSSRISDEINKSER